MDTADEGAMSIAVVSPSSRGSGRSRQGHVTGGHASSPRQHLHLVQPHDSPTHHVAEGASSGPPTDVSISDASSWILNVKENDREVNYPTSASEILDLLREKVAIFSGGRDREGQSIITFPAQHKNYIYQREPIRKVVQYLACIPAVEVRDFGFCVIMDARSSAWSSSKLILRTLQEALPGQIHVVYLLQPGQFWQKQQNTRGHNKEKARLEFTTIKVSSIEKLTRYVDGSQLTSELGGFLPYNHEQWLSLRLDLEHFVSLVSALMEHTHHIEQQIRMEQDDLESAEDQLKHHLPLQDMVRRAPRDASRKGNELLRALEREGDESGTGTAMTPDKINAVVIIRQLLEKIIKRQAELEELWKRRKAALEQTLQLKNFEKSVQKVKSWLKTRGEDMVVMQTDIGTSLDSVQALMEDHEKAEGKIRLQYNLLTQLRRSADRYSGEQHFAAANIQKQISKLSAKFTRFETKMAGRHSILDTSLHLHASLIQWRDQCKMVISVLKQETSEQEGEESQDDQPKQLQEFGNIVLKDAGALLELMMGASQAGGISEDGEGGGRNLNPDYSRGFVHVKRMMEEVENHQRRLGQLAEARKVQTEQLKQIDNCEKDAKQETRWLDYMRSQLSSTHGDVGVSVVAVDKLISEHVKFMETAKKSYKYGCGLISAAEKSRRSFKLDLQPNSALMDDHTSAWEKLLSGSTEVGDRLEMARHFHSLYEEVIGSFTEWMRPLHELPKTPELVEEKLQDIEEHRQQLFQRTDECLDTGQSLVGRLSRPVLMEPEFLMLNEHVQESQAYLKSKIGDLESRSSEVQEILPQQEELLREFITYCRFERKIETILLWLQRNGLKKLPTFYVVRDNRDSVQKQILEFEAFRHEAELLNEQVIELTVKAVNVETQITGFRSDLTRKTTSLNSVWGKFLQRIEHRGSVLTLALSFYTALEQACSCTSYLMSALTPRAIKDGGGNSYLNELITSKEELDECFESVVRDGHGLVEIFNRPPVDSNDPVVRITSQMKDLQVEKKKIDEMWDAAWERGKPIGQSSGQNNHGDNDTPSVDDLVVSGIGVKSVNSSSSQAPVTLEAKVKMIQPTGGGGSGKVEKVIQVGVSQKDSDKFSELEEEAYEYLGWLEAEYESFITTHLDFHDTSEDALVLVAEYEEFLEKLGPTCRKVERVIDLLTQLSPKAPLLSSAIHHLCQVVSSRIKKIKEIVFQCSSILQMFVKFCNLFKDLDVCLQALEGLVCEEFSNDIAVDAAQKLLESGEPLAEKLNEDYESARDIGEEFLRLTSEVLCRRGWPKLAVGGICTSVAVDLGDLEGRGPELLARWEEQKRMLEETVDWQAFKQTSDQVCAWLSESAELFLQNHTDTGTSLETAEDLVFEHHEFQIRAERTAGEVKMLLSRSEQLLAEDHAHSQTICELTGNLCGLHDNFQSRFKERNALLEGTMEFYHTAKELKRDMEEAIELCLNFTGEDLPSRLKITSISSHLSNLTHQGHTLTHTLTNTTPPSSSPKLATPSRRAKTILRSDSGSASELAIKEALDSLQSLFDSYKKHFESRILSHSSITSKSSNQGSRQAPQQVTLTDMDPGKWNGRREGANKEGTSGRKNIAGAVWASSTVGGGKVQTVVAVKDKVAALNRKSRDVEALQEPGKSYSISPNTRERAAIVDSASRKHTLFPNINASSLESPVSNVLLRRKGLSKAERTRKIEDIKKLFETSELEDLTSAAPKAPAWAPKSSSNVKLHPVPLATGEGMTSDEVKDHTEVKAEAEICLNMPPPLQSTPPSSDVRTSVQAAPPMVIRTVIKDQSPPLKKQVVNISVSDTNSASAVKNTSENSISDTNSAPTVKNTSENSISDTNSAPAVKNTSENSISDTNSAPAVKNTSENSISNTNSAPAVKNTSENSISDTNSAPAVKNTSENSISDTNSAPAVKNTSENSISDTNSAPVVKNTSENSISDTNSAPTVKNTSENSISDTNSAPTVKNTSENSISDTNSAPAVKNTSENSISDTNSAPVVKNTSENSINAKMPGKVTINVVETGTTSEDATPTSAKAGQLLSLQQSNGTHLVSPSSAPLLPADTATLSKTGIRTKGKVKGWGVLTGKVSSLREMFDSQSRVRSNTDSNLKTKRELYNPHGNNRAVSLRRKKSKQEPILTSQTIADLSLSGINVVHRCASDMPENEQTKHHSVEDGSNINNFTKENGLIAEVTPEGNGVYPAIIIGNGSCVVIENAPPIKCAVESSSQLSQLLDTSTPTRPRLPSPSVLSPSPFNTPPPRPPPPLHYSPTSNINATNTNIQESDSESYTSDQSEFGSSLLDQSDLEWLEDQTLEWKGDDLSDGLEVECDTDSSQVEPRPLLSPSSMLQKLILSEGAYNHSLRVLAESYLPLLSSSPHLPSFLQGGNTSILANIDELHLFHRVLYKKLSQVEDSLEDVCNTFIENEDDFRVYIPFLINMEQGLNILREYGGTFFTDHQRELGDDTDILTHYCSPRARLVQYHETFRDLCYSAQTHYQQGVSLVKETLRAVMRVLRLVDCTVSLAKLRGCPHKIVSDGEMICQEQFIVYSTRGKKRKPQVMTVLLHPSLVVFARKHKKKKQGGMKESYLEFLDALETSDLHLLETYKSDDEKFALCEGRLVSDNLLVLQATHHTVLVKEVWLQELRPIIQKRDTSRGNLVLEEEVPFPPFFQGVATHTPGKAWLRHSSSIRRSFSVLRRKKDRCKKTESEETIESLERGDLLNKLPQGLAKSESMVRSSVVSTTSSSTLPLTDIRLVPISSKEQYLSEERNDDVYMVTRASSVEGEEFLSVEVGQMVEVLDRSEKEAWLVLTLPRFNGEEQVEGFVPPQCLQPAQEVTKETTFGSNDIITQVVAGQDISQDEGCRDTITNGLGNMAEETGHRQQPPDIHPISYNSKLLTDKEEKDEGTKGHVDGDRDSEAITGQSKAPPISPPTDLDPLTTNQINFMDHSSGVEGGDENDSEQNHSYLVEASLPLEGSVELQCFSLPEPPPPPTRDSQQLYLRGEEALSCSFQSLPTSFSPKSTPISDAQLEFLGYNPMMIPTFTMSQPNIPKIKLDPSLPSHLQGGRQRGELSRLQYATVKASQEMSMEDFDPMEMYVAIADFEGVEKSNVSLKAGQCVQVLDTSRPDWWLVVATDNEEQGWVPANYLERRVQHGPSPSPEPFEDETEELDLIMKEQSSSVVQLNRRELYSAPFLAGLGSWLQEPSQPQLQGMFSIQFPYVAVTDIVATCIEQLSVVQDQPVRVLDSKRSDWWLVSTIPEEDGGSERPREGWVPSNLLQPDGDIQEDTLDTSIATTEATGEDGLAEVFEDSNAPQAAAPPSTQWVVLADYKATEASMLSVTKGELVNVLGRSKNNWCLISPASRTNIEGWVPSSFLRPHSDEGGRSHDMLPRYSLSLSDHSTEISGRSSSSSTIMSPDGLDVCDTEESRALAQEKLRYVLSELFQTEQDYIQKLHFCLMNYDPNVNKDSTPRALIALRNTLFVNLEDIYLFHKNKLLPRLMESRDDPTKLGNAFVEHEQELGLYVTYCQNKSNSDQIYHDFSAYFQDLSTQLKDRLKLPDYLILPVQRITKYGLLLADVLKYSVRAGIPGYIDYDLEVTRNISTLANNAIHVSLIDPPVRTEKFGKLILQGLFMCQESYGQNMKRRRIFLFKKALFITKARVKYETDVYAIKDQMMLHDISIVSGMDVDRRNLIIYDMVSGTKFILRALKPSMRDHWLAKSSSLIQQAKTMICNQMTKRYRSVSEPVELTRGLNFSLSRLHGLRRERNGFRRKTKRPSSSGAMRAMSPGSMEMVPAGTQFVVMECIVLEGEDDVTMEPGELVELVKDTISGAPLLRVRTTEQIKLEGNVPASFLRRKTALKGLQMESIPMFTMEPVDLDLSLRQTAIIGCAFNGYPPPSVTWKHDQNMVTSNEHRSITSCPTSSVLEIHQLALGDEGCYSCCINNTMGSDSATITLSLHGPPSEPQKPSVSKVTSTSLKLKWGPPAIDWGTGILSYQIELLQEGFQQWQPIVQQPRNYFVVKTLEPSTSYQFRVSAVNYHGFSSPSEASDPVVTKARGLLSASPNFRKTSASASSVLSQEVKDDVHEDDHLSRPLIQNESISNSYDIIPEELGRGRFGIVHCCQHRPSGLHFSAKFVRLHSRKKDIVRREVEILQKIRGKSPHIVEYQDAFERGRNLVIITEYVHSGEILEAIVAENNLTEGVAVGYLSQLLKAVETLHKIKIAHLDIRPENVLLSYDHVKLIDFGTARDLSQNETTPLFVSSVEFSAPEIINQETPTLAADMWSMGVFTYVLLSGQSPFFADNIQAAVEKVTDARYSFDHHFDNISQEAKDFIAALLQKSPEYRLCATKALSRSWIKMLDVRGRNNSPWLMAKLDTSQLKSFIARRKWQTSTTAVDDSTLYAPRSMLSFTPPPLDFKKQAKNEVPPRLEGRSEVTGIEGSSMTLKFKVIGAPVPSVMWECNGSEEITMSTHHRVVELSGAVASLTFIGLQCGDEGTYKCTALNSLGSASVSCQLTVLAVPGAPSDVNTIILGSYNSALISWLPPKSDGHNDISKYNLERCRLDLDMWECVAANLDGAAHVLDDLLPGVAYIFRVSAVNEVGVSPYSEPSEPVTIDMNHEYDSDSPTAEQVRMKMSAFELEYETNEEIYKGNYSRVVKCKEKMTDYMFAAKIVEVTENGGLQERVFQEVELLRELIHPRIVHLEDSFDNKSRIILVMEYLAGSTLAEYVLSHVNLTEYTTTRLLRKLCEGLQYLHDARIIHVNLTPDNILLTAGYGDLKIGGFGNARYIETGNQLTDLTYCGVEFLAPEVVTLQPLTTGADIWSTGVLACYMVTGHSPFLQDTDEGTISTITSATSLDLINKELVQFTPECKDFICGNTLTRNPRRRMGAPQCLKHKWLQAGVSSNKKMSTGEYSRHSSRRKSQNSPGKRKGSNSGELEGKSDSTKLIGSPARKVIGSSGRNQSTAVC